MASWAGKADPKPAKRIRASQADWSDLHEAFATALCVNNSNCGQPGQSLHHIVPRSQGGDDILNNLAPLCGDGTRGCHGTLESHAPGWERVAAAVRVYVLTDRERCVYVIGKLGWDRFGKRYPLLPEPGESSSGSDGRATPGSESSWSTHWENPSDKRRSPWDIPFEPAHFDR